MEINMPIQLLIRALFMHVDEIEYANNTNIFLVENCLLFLQSLANNHRKIQYPNYWNHRHKWKTTSKELINAVLETQLNVLATKGI